MKVIGKNILLKNIVEKVENDIGLIITTKQDEKSVRYKKAEVVKVGSDVDIIKDKDIVYYDFAQASEIRVSGEKFVVVGERGIVVIE